MQRAGIVAREPTALRYYDEDRDYQPGVQRALGSRGAGHETMIELPATMTASGARQLVNDRANRGRWQRETILWRIGQLDPTLQPGEIVRVPGLQGLWFVQRWEWFDRGIELVLERLPPNVLAAPPSDPGSANPPFDEVIPPTTLAAFEVPADASAGTTTPIMFAAASAQNKAWRGAALYRVQGNTLVPLGTSGTARAIIGALVEPLPASSALLFEPDSSMLVDLVADDLALTDSDLEGLAMGANRLLVGSEVIQFAQAMALGSRRWRLQGLLRGRGGTEPQAALGHAAQTAVILLDDALVPLDPVEVPPIASTRIAAIGTGDVQAVIAPLANAGLSRRPPMPVHPLLVVDSDETWILCWTRRARGHWRWDDAVDVPLVEEKEAYLVGYGPVDAPYAAWTLSESRLNLAPAERAALVAAYGPAAIWVKQIGTFDHSHPLLLAELG
jgi:hypothetical protein